MLSDNDLLQLKETYERYKASSEVHWSAVERNQPPTPPAEDYLWNMVCYEMAAMNTAPLLIDEVMRLRGEVAALRRERELVVGNFHQGVPESAQLDTGDGWKAVYIDSWKR